jgi:ketosteroid isomerase-like protein
MAEDSVRIVRRMYETWNEHGPAAIQSMLAGDVELHDAAELPDAEVWRGREAVVSRLDAVATALGGGSVDFQGFRASGEDVIVAMCWLLDREPEEVQLGQVFHRVRVSDGLITRVRVFLTEADAQRA